jgi:hypothetical protein
MKIENPARRNLVIGSAIAAATGGWTKWAGAQAKEVKIGVVVPLSGAWARNGELPGSN